MAKRPGRTQPGGSGRSRNDSALGAGLGALMGGGGETAGYGEAASAVKDGTLSSPGPEYDPRAATSAHGVLTPSLQAAYDQGPFKPLNWFGKLTGQKDLADQWTLSHAAGLDALENQKALEAYHQQQTLAGVPALAAANTNAQIASANDVANANALRQMKELAQYQSEQQKLHPGQLVPTMSPGDLKFGLGSQWESIGVPAATERMNYAQGRIPGASVAGLADQNRDVAVANLGRTTANQHNNFESDPANASLINGSIGAGYRHPLLANDAAYLANQAARANAVFNGTEWHNGMLFNAPGSLVGEAMPGEKAGKFTTTKGPDGKDVYGISKATPPSFVPASVPNPGGGSFTRSVSTGYLQPSFTMPSDGLIDYGSQKGPQPTATPQAAPMGGAFPLLSAPNMGVPTPAPIAASAPMFSNGKLTATLGQTDEEKQAEQAQRAKAAAEAEKRLQLMLKPYSYSY